MILHGCRNIFLLCTYKDTDRLIERDMSAEVLFPTRDETFQPCTGINKIFSSAIQICVPTVNNLHTVAFFQDISGLGLRHVGYAIPAELFAPFVGSAVEVFSGVTSNETAISGFTWAMQLVSKTLGCAWANFEIWLLWSFFPSTSDLLHLHQGSWYVPFLKAPLLWWKLLAPMMRFPWRRPWPHHLVESAHRSNVHGCEEIATRKETWKQEEFEMVMSQCPSKSGLETVSGSDTVVM